MNQGIVNNRHREKESFSSGITGLYKCHICGLYFVSRKQRDRHMTDSHSLELPC